MSRYPFRYPGVGSSPPGPFNKEPVSHCFCVLHRINTHVDFVDLQDFSKGFHGHWANNISTVSLFLKISPLEMIGWITVFRCTPCPGSPNFKHSAKITIQRISMISFYLSIGKMENLKDIKYNYLFKERFCHVPLLGTWSGRGPWIHHQVNLTNIIVNSTVHNQFITLVSCHDQIWEMFADHNKIWCHLLWYRSTEPVLAELENLRTLTS